MTSPPGLPEYEEWRLTSDVPKGGLTRDALRDHLRWNPGSERWQSAEAPVDPPRPPDPDPWAGLDELAWEVRLRFDRHADADRLVRKLEADGTPVLAGWRRCLVAVADEQTARPRAGELRLSAPFAAIEVRPITRFRRWMIRQKAFGNYGE